MLQCMAMWAGLIFLIAAILGLIPALALTTMVVATIASRVPVTSVVERG